MRITVLSMVFISAFLPGCGASKGTAKPAPADPWNRFPPAVFTSAKNLTDVVPEQFALVIHNEDDALTKLADSPWVKVTADEAKAYTGRAFDAPGGELVLLRALALDEAKEPFSVTWRGGEVRVHHDGSGNSDTRQRRRAIIAHLPETPKEVYVDCNMAR